MSQGLQISCFLWQYGPQCWPNVSQRMFSVLDGFKSLDLEIIVPYKLYLDIFCWNRSLIFFGCKPCFVLNINIAMFSSLTDNGFPQAFRCVDGTHIPILSPSENLHDYFSYRMQHTINVQGVCDYKGTCYSNSQ